MKKSFLYVVIATGLIALSASCNNKTVPVKTEEVTPVVKQPSITDVLSSDLPTTDNADSQIPHSSEADCHGVRKTIRRIKNQDAEILKIGENYLLSIPPGTRRYNPCEVPEDFQTEGLKVTFTGLQLEIFPNERLMGTPLRLEDISLTQ